MRAGEGAALEAGSGSCLSTRRPDGTPGPRPPLPELTAPPWNQAHWLGAGELQEFSRGQDCEGGTRPDSPEPGVGTVGERLVERAREAGPDRG